MEPIIDEEFSLAAPAIDIQKIDLCIKECQRLAHTCRVCAEEHAFFANKVSMAIDVSLECAKTCESLTRALIQQKKSGKIVPHVQIEACIVTCRLCSRHCREVAYDFECFVVCADAALRCAEIIATLLPKRPRSNRSKFFSFFKTPRF
jgi:hypothetical protein